MIEERRTEGKYVKRRSVSACLYQMLLVRKSVSQHFEPHLLLQSDTHLQNNPPPPPPNPENALGGADTERWREWEVKERNKRAS